MFDTLRVLDKLLGGWSTSLSLVNKATELDTEFSVPGTRGGFRRILDYTHLRDSLISNLFAMEVVFASSRALADVMNNNTVLTLIYNDATLKAMLEANVNDGSYYIKRTAYTSSGTYNPTNGTEYLSLFGVGHGGAGHSVVAASGNSGQGGSGGQVEGKIILPKDLPTSSVTVTIPTSSGSPTTFGSFLSVASGTDGIASVTNNSGAGTISDPNLVFRADDPSTQAFLLSDFTWSGGAGGGGGIAPNAGTAGYQGAGGSINSGGPNGGGAGTGISSGGAGGDDSSGNSAPGEDATAYGAGGGGAFYGTTDDAAADGGSGGPAVIFAYYVEKRAA